MPKTVFILNCQAGLVPTYLTLGSQKNNKSNKYNKYLRYASKRMSVCSMFDLLLTYLMYVICMLL